MFLIQARIYLIFYKQHIFVQIFIVSSNGMLVKSQPVSCDVINKPKSFCIILFAVWKESLTPVNIYLLKVNNKNTRKRCEIYSKLIVKGPKQRQWRRSSVFIVNFEHISHLFLVFLLLTFTNCRTWLFFNKYAHENIFSVSWVLEAILRN